jgi:hypothetical protein
MNRIAAILAVCTSLVALPAAAEKTPEPVQKLGRLVGTWKGKGTLKMGKEVANLTATWTCQPGAGGFGIRCALALKGIPGLPLYEEMDIMGFDPGDGLVHWYSVTNAGETHDHKGSWDGDTLQVTFTGPKGGELYSECVTIKPAGKGSIRITSAVFEGQKPGPFFDLTASK